MSKTDKISMSYFFIHALVEIVCFNVLFQLFHYNGILWPIALIFDFFAFVPQGLIGDFYNNHKEIDLGLMGVGLMMAGVCILEISLVPGLIILAIGNSFVHEAGAVATVYSSKGKLFPSALFVAGGSFGVVTGQYSSFGFLFRMVCLVMMLALVLYSNRYWRKEKLNQPKFDLVNPKQSFMMIVMVAFIVVSVRSFIGYCIPISWKKQAWQAFALFFIMGLGKAAGGFLADYFGAKKVAVISTLLCIPFLVFGKDYMLISIIGVFMFSLTMSITFGMFLSVIDDNPGLAFGLTTVGLFAGTLPIFIFGQFTTLTNIIIVIVLSLISSYGLSVTLK